MIASALAFSSGQHSPSQVKYHRGSSVAIYLTLLLRHRSEGVHIPVLLTKVVWHAIAAGTLDTSQQCVMADLRFPSFLGHTFSSFITFFFFFVMLPTLAPTVGNECNRLKGILLSLSI